MEITDTGYWTGQDVAQNHTCCEPLAGWIIDYLKDDKEKLLYDFGCGIGSYLIRLERAGFTKLTGFEGDPPANRESSHVHKHDLTVPLNLFHQGNVLSLEVAEHIPAQYQDEFVSNLARACDGKLILSWAVRGQAGHGHVNCLDNLEAITVIEKAGFKYLPTTTGFARSAVLMDQSHPWFHNTLLIFEKVSGK